ncbi:SPOR domain-containing protein [Parabacteroides sp. PF5-6]|uniref:HU domain-containing protein n=1 Tax=Parabacteroides sp. PF5-6 TaxID=1742403 RepID=UPI002404D1EE|nr:SPOR domain-containing protein [Parabacteroides sp. PF5-6]MDF9831435.1 hypothetical protein [Parabacteroides sp. PF5-6]
MLRITTHIERLLFIHDCVIIPGIGGFVLQTVPSVYRKEDHTFAPMHKEIVFNSALQHNDSLLTGSYMQTYGADYRKAQAMVDEDIAEIQSALQQYGKAALGTIGSLTRGEEGQLIFHRGKADRFDVDYYGLSSFHFPALPPLVFSEDREAEFKRKKDMFYIPVNKRFIRGAVASAAAIALFFLISTPVKDIKQSAYTASILPCEILLPKTTTVAEPESETVAIVDIAKETPIPPATSQKMYHIIIGSFPDQEKADEYMAGIDQSLYRESGLVVRDNRYRVYIRKFDNRQDAETYLSVIREGEKHKDAWLFISR